MLILAQPEKKPMHPAVQARSRTNPSRLLAPLSPQLAKSSDDPKREFQAICDFPSPSPRALPHPTTFREEKTKPLDQSNLFLTHFHSQGLPLREEGDRNKSDILALGTWGRSSRNACRVVGMRFRSLGACSYRPGSQKMGSVIQWEELWFGRQETWVLVSPLLTLTSLWPWESLIPPLKKNHSLEP